MPTEASSNKAADRYQKLEKIGEGSCGVVFKCHDREGGVVVALKKVRFSYDEGDDEAGDEVFGATSSVLREVSLLHTLKGHPNITEIRDVLLESSGRIFIVSEYLERNLRGHMDSSGHLHPRRVKLYAWQLMQGLAHCHAHCIAHRDVKPHNLLVSPEADVLKLCDFSLAKRVVLPGSEQTRRVASLWYRSPEILLGGEACGFLLDVWSAGCVIGEMMTHHPLFPGDSEIGTIMLQLKLLGTPGDRTWAGVQQMPHWSRKFPKFKAGGFRTVVSRCLKADHVAAQNFLSAVLVWNPEVRSSIEAALTSEYFDDLDHLDHSAVAPHEPKRRRCG